MASRYPGQRDGEAGRRLPRRLPGMVRRGNTQRRLCRRRPRRTVARRSRAVRSVPGRGRQTGRSADGRHPRHRPVRNRRPQGHFRAGLGLHRHLPDRERRRIPHRVVPRRLQGDLGLQGRRRHIASRAGGVLCRHPTPGPHGHRAVGQAVGAVEQARGRVDRHRSRTRPPTGATTASRQRDPGIAEGQRLRPRSRRGGPHRPAPGERRQPGHQELHQGNAGVLPGVRRRRQPVLRRLALLPRRWRDHVLRRHRDGRLSGSQRGCHQGRHG